jgi:hypothetical protein
MTTAGLLDFAGAPHGGVQRLLPEWNTQPVIRPLGIIDHSQVGSTDGTFLLFRDRSGLESHFSVRGRRSATRNGLIEQFSSIDRQADANLQANRFTVDGVACGYLSIETEDDGDPDTQPWTREQLDSLVWLHERLATIRPSIRRREATSCFGGGLGYHTKLGAPSCWTPVAKTCPGGVRKIQWEATLLPVFLQPTQPEVLELTPDEFLTALSSPRAQTALKTALGGIGEDVAANLGPLLARYSAAVRIFVRRTGDNRIYAAEGGQLFHVQNPGQFAALTGGEDITTLTMELPPDAPVWAWPTNQGPASP